MFQDDDEETYQGKYENGHWEWDNNGKILNFVSDLPPSQEEIAEMTQIIIRAAEFKDDIDLWEQQKFRKRIQRKCAEEDIVTLQDVKDVVLFTAPSSILSSAVINLLHLPTTERFLRALILYCQYYLQISESMNNRTIELETKIRTKTSEEIESKYREDLEDLRILIAKEYSTILLGGEKFAKYHHMGPKKITSLSKKDSILFETIIRISIQIVWIALGRMHFNHIGKKLELNRIFKSDIYNSAEHKLGTDYLNQMNARDRFVLLGGCLHSKKKLNTQSPLINEVYCDRNINFRMFGLGATKYTGLSGRLRFLEVFLSQPERDFGQLDISLGIIGQPRSSFDTMLKVIKTTATTSSSSASMKHTASRSSRASRVMSSRKSTGSGAPLKLYPDIYIPEVGSMNLNFRSTPFSSRKIEDIEIKEIRESLPEHFPLEPLAKLPSNEEQRLKWLKQVLSRKKRQ